MASSFDLLLNRDCTILRTDPNVVDAYGNKTGAKVAIATVKARLDQLKSRPVEFKQDKKTALDRGVVFMRPTDVTEADDLVIDGQRLDILNVIDPSGIGHHLEIYVEIVKP